MELSFRRDFQVASQFQAKILKLRRNIEIEDNARNIYVGFKADIIFFLFYPVIFFFCIHKLPECNSFRNPSISHKSRRVTGVTQ